MESTIGIYKSVGKPALFCSRFLDESLNSTFAGSILFIMKAKYLLPSIFSIIGLVISAPVAFGILIIMWLFIYGEGLWPDVYGMDMIAFVITVSAVFFTILGFCSGLMIVKLSNKFASMKKSRS